MVRYSSWSKKVLCKSIIIGSNPIRTSIYRGVVHLVERVVWDHQVARSSRVTPTNGYSRIFLAVGILVMEIL